jgi:hypothetical protein
MSCDYEPWLKRELPLYFTITLCLLSCLGPYISTLVTTWNNKLNKEIRPGCLVCSYPYPHFTHDFDQGIGASGCEAMADFDTNP